MLSHECCIYVHVILVESKKKRREEERVNRIANKNAEYKQKMQKNERE